VKKLEAGGPAMRRVLYYAPVDGVVSSCGEGRRQRVRRHAADDLSDLSQVWVIAQVSEDQRPGVPGKSPR